MHHPWRALRRLTKWTRVFAPLPPGYLGVCDYATRTIILAPGQSQAQRRSTIAHAVEHAERGEAAPGWAAQDEARVRAAAARRLVSIEALVDAARWARSWHELAEELWVDEDTARARVEHLRAGERALIDAVVRDRG